MLKGGQGHADNRYYRIDQLKRPRRCVAVLTARNLEPMTQSPPPKRQLLRAISRTEDKC